MRLYLVCVSLGVVLAGCGADEAQPGSGDSQCGNGLVNAGEQCDDQNTDNDDECNNECRFSCGDGSLSAAEVCDTGIAAGEPGACPETPADCDDGVACTTDTVTGSFCEAACDNAVIDSFVDGDGCCPELEDATAYYDFDCAPTCGNALVERGEHCDTAIAAGEIGACPTHCGDGVNCTNDTLVIAGGECQARCEYTAVTELRDGDGCCGPGGDVDTDSDCTESAQCGDGLVNGGIFNLETCDTAIAPGNDGACPTECPSDDTCRPSLLLSEGTCRAVCHDYDIAAPADGDMCCPLEYGGNNRNDGDCTSSCGTPAAECNFGDPFCDTDCRIIRTAFRVTALSLQDPHIYFKNGESCTDLTSVANDSTFPDAIAEDGDGDGFADLTILNVFKPLDQSQVENPFELVFGDCLPNEDPAMTTCSADPLTARVAMTVENIDSGECLAALPNTITESYETPPTATQGPCFVSSEFDADLKLGSLTIPLEGAQVAAAYTGDPATGLVDGLLRGFVSEAAAEAAIIPESVTLIGGRPLHDVLAGGIEPGSCNVGVTPIGDDRDTGPDGTTQGWWFYVNFTAAEVPFDDRPNASR